MKFSIVCALCVAAAVVIAGCNERNLDKGSNPLNKSDAPAVTTQDKVKVESSVPEALDEGKKELLEQDEKEEKVEKEPLALEIDKEQLEKCSGDLVPWGFGPHFTDEGRSVSCEGLQEKYKDKNAVFIGDKENVVYLTFDEGYENGFSEKVLDILKEKDAKATFFITGDYYRREKELIQRMIDEGHTVGSHSDKHIDFAVKSIDDCYNDVVSLQENMRNDFDYEMRLFRFPGGSFSERSLEMINQMGYKSIFWSFGYKDWDPKVQMEPQEALKKLTESLHQGEVLLLHPVGSTNCEILGELIDEIRNKGFEIATFE